MTDIEILNKFGIDATALSQYQILCLPENIDKQSQQSELIDSGDSITLSKLLKEEGVKCANSYDLELHAKVSERRGLDIWLGSIWILEHAALPILTGVVGRWLWEEVINKPKVSQETEDSDMAKVHASLKIIDGKVSSADIIYHGDVDTFLKALKGINNDQYTLED